MPEDRATPSRALETRADCETALARVDGTGSLYQWAQAQFERGNALMKSRADAAQIRAAIACYDAALEIQTREFAPDNWANIQNNRGNAFHALREGDRAANLHAALACYDAALTVYTREDSIREWAEIVCNKANALDDFEGANRSQKTREAIALFDEVLAAVTPGEWPQIWADAQNDKGCALKTLGGLDDDAARYRAALACFDAALTIYDKTTAPHAWARAQNNKGNAFDFLAVGDSAEAEADLERALECYEAALTVYTREEFPDQWASAQINRAGALLQTRRGDANANRRAAIACCEAAITVETPATAPSNWALAQSHKARALVALDDAPPAEREANLRAAIACYDLAIAALADDDSRHAQTLCDKAFALTQLALPRYGQAPAFRAAIECYRAALALYDLPDEAQSWANAQECLGLCYHMIFEDDRAPDLRAALGAYDAALTVYTKQDFADEWVTVQLNKGEAWARLSEAKGETEGNRISNLRAALACFEAVLTVATRQTQPKNWARAQQNKGDVLAEFHQSEGGDWRVALECYRAALTVDTPDETAWQWAGAREGVANLLTDVADNETDEARRDTLLREAIAHYDAAIAALEGKWRETWAHAQRNKGLALGQFSHQGAQRKRNLIEQLACYDAALSFYTRDERPGEWTTTQVDRALTLAALKRFDEATTAVEAAIKTLRRQGAPAQLERAKAARKQIKALKFG